MTDLIEEVRDGHVFLSLLEVLLGTTLVSLKVFIDHSTCLLLGEIRDSLQAIKFPCRAFCEQLKCRLEVKTREF